MKKVIKIIIFCRIFISTVELFNRSIRRGYYETAIKNAGRSVK